MAIQTINIGTNPNDGTGDDLRTAFDKVNDNFTELLAVGGETNTASNLGIGEGVFKVKTAQNLEFKSLRNSDGTIALTSDGNSVYINTTNLADNDFGAIQVDNGDTLTASSSGQLVGIKSGNANIVVTKSGNDIVITGAFEVGDDATPQLGGDLSILGNSIIGGAGSTITSIGSIDSDSMNTDNLTVNTNAIITGTSQFGGLITANGGLTLGAGQTISGNINGGIQGQLTGTLDTNAQTISGDGKVIIDTADISVQGQLGSEFGLSYRTKPSPLTVQTSVDLPVDLITVTSFRDIALNALNVETVVNKALSGGQSYTTGAGSTISFTINDSDNNSLGLGAVGASVVDATVNQVALLPFQTGRPPASQPVYFTFNSSGVATLNDIEISETGIKTNVSNKNLTLDANGTGTVDFYNAYQFPRTIGNAGEVLVVPVSGTELAWGAGGGGGGGSSTFVGLSDTPASYAGGAADAGKILRVASGGSALEFVTLTSVVDSSYIDTNGGLLKAGGTMSGDLNLGTNDITNTGTVTATNVNATTVTATNITGILTGDLTGSVFADDSTTIIDAQNNTGTFTTLSATTVTANLTGNATGSHVGTLDGDVTGSVFGDDSTLIVDGVANKVLLTNNTTTELTEGTNLYYTDGRVDARVTQAFVNALNITASSTVGTVDGDLTGSVFADDSTLIVDGVNNIITTTKITATNAVSTTSDIGSLHIEGTQIAGPSNSNLTITSQGTGHIHLDGDVRIDGTLSHVSNQVLTIAGTASPQTIETSSNNTFVTTNDWTAVGADQAYSNLGAGTVDGQMKTIKVVSRGQFSVNGGATFVDRYLIVNLTINGSVGTLNVSQNSEYGAVTLVWYNASWWIVSQFDS
tara:strand:- start:7072 stop:9669 length:2598 start_codon:yes stop_codon:yes gene_type:complete